MIHPPAGIEVRAAVELRAVAGGRRLEGHAAVFGQPTLIGGAGGFMETVMPGCFARSLASGRDMLALADHDPTRLLGRTKSGTLRLTEDARGLAFSIDLPQTAAASDLLALVERNDVGGASFAFSVPKGGDAWPARDRRQLLAVDLHEVSVVSAFPAYSGTDVSARARGIARNAVRIRLLSVL